VAIDVISGAVFAVASTTTPTVVFGCESVGCDYFILKKTKPVEEILPAFYVWILSLAGFCLVSNNVII
jgi:hypothetical protein